MWRPRPRDWSSMRDPDLSTRNRGAGRPHCASRRWPITREEMGLTRPPRAGAPKRKSRRARAPRAPAVASGPARKGAPTNGSKTPDRMCFGAPTGTPRYVGSADRRDRVSCATRLEPRRRSRRHAARHRGRERAAPRARVPYRSRSKGFVAQSEARERPSTPHVHNTPRLRIVQTDEGARFRHGRPVIVCGIASSGTSINSCVKGTRGSARVSRLACRAARRSRFNARSGPFKNGFFCT